MKKVFSILTAAIVMATMVACDPEEEQQQQQQQQEQRPDGSSTAFDANGATRSLFSVADGHRVHFACGNLQYNAAQGSHTVAGGGTAQGTWRFANHQWDTIGSANLNGSATYDGWIDLYGWGTSGWNNGNTNYQPWVRTSTLDENESHGYGPTDGTSYTYSLAGNYANADWGAYNAISNGGNTPGMWRTPTNNEWDFLIRNRSASTLNGTENARYTAAQVNGIAGIILFPDSYSHPADVPLPEGVNTASTTSIYTVDEWSKMEAAGCVFLPAAGTRGVSEYIKGYSSYWSSTFSEEDISMAYCLSVDSYISTTQTTRSSGYPVRLIKD